jgi:DNA-binding response OmpR family regulator
MTDPQPDLDTNDVQIVVVEDDDDALEALMRIVELDGHRVEGAGSAEEAMRILERTVPHCVVLDLGLPDQSGAELARQIRSRCGKGVVLIAVTGTTDEDLLLDAEEAGVDYLLPKPLDIDRFRRLVPPLH